MNKIRRGPLPELLHEKNVSPQELAGVAGVELRAIHRLIEGSTKNLSKEKLQVVAEMLGIEAVKLCDLIQLQRDLRGLLRIREQLADFNASLTFYCEPIDPRARRWAPSRDVATSVVAKLQELVENDFGLPEMPAGPPKRPPKDVRASAGESAN